MLTDRVRHLRPACIGRRYEHCLKLYLHTQFTECRCQSLSLLTDLVCEKPFFFKARRPCSKRDIRVLSSGDFGKHCFLKVRVAGSWDPRSSSLEERRLRSVIARPLSAGPVSGAYTLVPPSFSISEYPSSQPCFELTV